MDVKKDKEALEETLKDNCRDYYRDYTLQEILDGLPSSIGNNTLVLQRYGDKWWGCLYIEPYTRNILHMEIKEKCTDAAYEMLCWCIENGYIKKG